MKHILSREYAHLLSLNKQDGAIPLPECLTIKEIGELIYTDDDELKHQLFSNLMEACKSGELNYSGNLKEIIIKPELLNDPELLNNNLADIEMSEDGSGFAWNVIDPPGVKIHHNDLKKYLENNDYWPLENCLLVNWWPESEKQIETVENDSTVSHNDINVVKTMPIQTDNNIFKNSSLLNVPQKKDDWFDVIVDMTKAFYDEYKTIPKESEAWSQLCSTPPKTYGITTGKDKGSEDCLKMLGSKNLSKSAFKKRWKKYTANKTQ